MKKIFLVAICFFVTAFACAQAPSLQWAKGMIGTSDSNGASIALDAYGNVYTAGIFSGTVDFDPGVGVYNLTSMGAGDLFISKLDASGNFVWAKNMGGVGTAVVVAYSIVIDASDNVYTTGYFKGTADFDPGVLSDSMTASGNKDIFISKLDSSGNFVWAKSIGGTSEDIGHGITLDASNNVYVTGVFELTVDFDPEVGVFNLISAGLQDAFVLKLDAIGNFVWVKQMKGTFCVLAISSIMDLSGNIYTIGSFAATADFDPNAGVFNLTSIGGYDIFISKLDSSGNFVWAKNMGGPSYDHGYSITLDAFGGIYCTGGFQGTVDFDPNAGIFNLSSNGSFDIFISKLDNSGNFVWAKNIGGPSGDFGSSIKLDGLENIYITGYFIDTVDFDSGLGVYNLNSNGSSDIFISKLDNSGNFVWAENTGGVSSDEGGSIALDGANNVYITGQFVDTVDFDPGGGVFNLISEGGSWNIFVQKLSQTPLGIAENTSSNIIFIYPNPSNGQFNIIVSSPTKNESVEIYNSIGALVYSQKIFNEQNTIELTNEANGLYFVKVMSEGKIVGTKKIIKE